MTDQDPPRQNPPGKWAWGLTIASLVLPVLAIGCGWLGITNQGNDIHVPLFITSFSGMVISLILSVIVHFWGLVKAFYPAISKPWIAVSVLGIVGGILTLIAAVMVWLRMFGML